MFSPSLSPEPQVAASISPFSRKNFDDRAQALVATQLRAPRVLPAENGVFKRLQQLQKQEKSSENLIHWTETSQICKTLDSEAFMRRFGVPLAVELTPTHILVGTQLGGVAAFDYRQKLDFLLDLNNGRDTEPVDLAPVTCVAISANGLYICTGHADGRIVVWETPRDTAKTSGPALATPYLPINGVLKNLTVLGVENASHLHGLPVATVCFVGDLHHNVVSTDICGVVVFHHVTQKLFRKSAVSTHIWGPKTIHMNPMDSVHDTHMLPVGTAPHISDHLGLLAVISAGFVHVILVCSLDNDTTSYPKPHFTAPRPKSVFVLPQEAPAGCVRWYPAIQTRSGGRKRAKLAYAWNNVLTVVELADPEGPDPAMALLAELRNKNRAIPRLDMVTTGRWTAPETNQKIVALQWLNSEILSALMIDTQMGTTKLHFFYYNRGNGSKNGSGNTLEWVGVDSIDSQSVASINVSSAGSNFQSNPNYNSDMHLYTSSFRIFRHRPVVLVESHSACQKKLLTGTTSKWADRLVGLISAQDFISALLCAFDFYCSENTGRLLLNGLPHTTRERHDVVKPFLLDIMRESIEPIFGRVLETRVLLEDALWLYFHLCGTITSDCDGDGNVATSEILVILDGVHETVLDKGVFFNVLEKFLLAGEIKTLPPTVFKSLIETYVNSGHGDHLTEIICLLDPSTLNIDLAVKLCHAHGLRECLVYIWTALLKDYLRPLLMLMEDMDTEIYDLGQKNLVYTYMSYILSGRQFPTDVFLNTTDEISARNVICKVLFSLSEISSESTSEFHIRIENTSVFPYLYKFLRSNTFETLATLNEFFENPCLNTDAKGELNRQYIIDALLDIFTENHHAFSTDDRVHLAIFLARNYPKYFQFIRLSDSVLEETVEMLCSCSKDRHADAELALESLLPVYDVKNEAFFHERIKAAKFYRVAFSLNRSMQKFSSALEIWLEQQKDDETKDLHRNFTALSDIVSNTFQHKSVSQTEQIRLLHIIEDHFEELISRYLRDMVMLANSHNVSIHRMVLKCKNNQLAYEYLKMLFEETEFPDFGPAKISLVARFIGLSCVFARQKVGNLVDTFSPDLINAPAELDLLRKKLRQEKCFDALAILSRNYKAYDQAVEELREAFVLAVQELEYSKIDGLITIGVSVCEKDKGCWRHLIQTLVSLPKPSGHNSAFTDLVNQGIYRCFRKIIDMGEKEHNPEFFAEILQGVMEEATVSHVREVLQETLTSFYFDSEIHNITLLKLNGRIRKHMEYVKIDNLRGWILKDKMCASCGKPMWGDDIAERHREAWVSREKARVFLGKFEKQQFKDCELAFFKCTHGYHTQCLERLGSMGKCVICTE